MDLVFDDKNDICVEAVTNDDDEGRIAPANIILLKGIARKLEASQNAARPMPTRSRKASPQKHIGP